AIAAAPCFLFLEKHLSHWTGASRAVAWLDGATFLELARQLRENSTSENIGLDLGAAALAMLLISPFMAGAMVTAARSDEPLPLSRLLAGAGELYGRMLRTFLVGLVPLAAGSGLAWLALKIATKVNERAIWETTANRNLLLALVASAALVFLGHLIVDAARAQFAADPLRHSAVLALWSALRLILRQPLRALAVGALGALAGL